VSVQVQFTLKQLSYFVAAGESGSILKAAENIHVSQPSISNAIAHLESVFQLQLFIRHHAQGMSLTTAGSQIMEQAKRLLRDADELNGFAGKLSDQVFGSINSGCFIPLAPIVTPELCHDFMQAHSDAGQHQENHSSGYFQPILLRTDKYREYSWHGEPWGISSMYIDRRYNIL
jgi:DNA-binding transcriptional LysR family regulator